MKKNLSELFLKHAARSSILKYRPRKVKPKFSYWNWVDKGAVTPIRDQKSCGSCYAFSICAAIESAILINTGHQVVLSPQQIVDCSGRSTIYKNLGCDGGGIESSFEYVKLNGLESETDYPYRNRQSKCTYTTDKEIYKISSFDFVYNDLKGMYNGLIKKGPLVVFVSASSKSFINYASGIYNDIKCSSNEDSLDHALDIVGYGTDETTKQDYWLLKNSWGKDWGENGFMRIARGINKCGIETISYFPIY